MRLAAPLARALRAIAVLMLAALALGVPAASAWADGGSVDLGVSVSKEVEAPEAGAHGSVDLGIGVGYASDEAGRTETDAGGSVDIGIAVGQLGYHEVSFVGIYCDDYEQILADQREPLGAQKVAYGDAPLAPADADRDGYWADGWYLQDPSVYPDAEPVSLDEIDVTADTVLYCLWKKGYVIKLDANNGDDEAAAELFGGTVAAPGQVMVPRDLAYDEDGGEAPAGVAYADFPEATRPGYAFKGWYWPETKWQAGQEVPKTDEHGRAVLSEAAGPVVPADGSEGEMPYDDLRAHSGDTLYAKWEVAPSVRILLDGARDADMQWGIHLWFWPGRGYAMTQPVADMELRADAVITQDDVASAPHELTDLADSIAHNPVPTHPTQFFSGWGYANAIKTDSGYQDDQLIRCDGEGGDYAYLLTERAFAPEYVGDDLAWADTAHTTADDAEGAAAGSRKTTWDALATTAQIRVKAPFEVTFEKEGATAEERSYTTEELTWVAGSPEWIESQPQEFTNLSDRSVYVSKLECVNVGASAILPGGMGGTGRSQYIFSLYEEAGSPEDEPGAGAGGTAIRFGYWDQASRVTVNALDPDAWIVLPGRDAEPAGADKPQRLYYGLNLRDAGFSPAAIAVGDGDQASYVAKVANVKYTYSIVP